MKIIPLIILGALSMLSLGFHIAKHKEPSGYYDGGSEAIAVLIEWALIWWAFQ